MVANIRGLVDSEVGALKVTAGGGGYRERSAFIELTAHASRQRHRLSVPTCVAKSFFKVRGSGPV